MINKKTILVLENNEINRNIIKNTIEEKYNLVFVDDENMTFERIKFSNINKNNSISLIILGEENINMNNLDFLKDKKENETVNSIPVIVLAKSDNLSYQEEAIRLGANDIVLVPISNVILLNKINNIFVQTTKLEDMKMQLLTKMSHDIRTPMNAIIGMTSIANNINKEPKVKECLDVIKSSSNFLLSLMNDILDIAKIETGEFTLEEKEVPVGRFIETVDFYIRPLMEEKNITFECQMMCGLEVAMLDELRFNQIFYNVLSNAAKYTNPGGKVLFKAIKLSDSEYYENVRFTVEDNGKGMSDEFTSHAFDTFRQENVLDEMNQPKSGLGLGLTIAKYIVRKMNGSISIESEEGKGTKITIDLPIKKVVKKKDERCPETRYVKLIGKDILIVEDNVINAMVASKILQNNGAIVHVACNGKEAVQTFLNNENKFDLILMDVYMPLVNGLQATKQIRTSRKHNSLNIPIIAMSANLYDMDIKECESSGMNDYVSKPIQRRSFLETICKYL